MELRDKLFIAGVSVFIVIVFISNRYDGEVCDPAWKDINRKLYFIKTPYSVKQIELYKASGYKMNLVSDTLLITDIKTIETIRSMIVDRVSGTWHRPASEWEVKMRVALKNNEVLEFEVRKINNDQKADMTHIYFGIDHCPDKLPNCSLTLGNYLETLTNYKEPGY